MRTYYVYILAAGPMSGPKSGPKSGRNVDLDFGVTGALSDLPPRRLARLVWCEDHIDLRSTLRRELQLQRAPSEWVHRLIDQANPAWADLRDTITPARAA